MRIFSCFIFFIIFIYYSCKTSIIDKSQTKKIFIEILNKDTIYDGSIVNIRFVNNSDIDYCFLYDTISDKLITPVPLESFFMKNDIFHIYDSSINDLNYYFNSDFCNQEDSINIHNIKIKYRKSINNLIKLKSNSSLTCKIKFKSEIYYSSFCWGNYIRINGDKNYFLKAKLTYFDTFLSEEMKDSITNLGFEIYKDTLVSNTVPFKFKD